MTPSELRKHIATLQRLKCDTESLEAKAAAAELPQHLWKTLSAFSNTRGGAIILGLAERDGFALAGVRNPGKVQQDLGSVCSDMEPSIRPLIQAHRIDGKSLVTAEVSELPKHSKPCYYRSAGYTNGAFVRVSDGNRKLSQYEVHNLLAARGQPVDDEEPVPGAGLDVLQPRLVKAFLSRLRRRPNGNLARLSDEKVLRTLKALVRSGNRHVCSLAGLLAFGKRPQQFFPGLNLTFVVYPATDVGEPGPRDERFLDNERIDGAIPDMLAPILRALRRNMKTRSVVRGLYRADIEEYPAIAVREAIVNALAHRDLSGWARSTPVQVQMFADRLVVYNPGGLYGPVSVDDLGRDGVCARRNAVLMHLLEDTPAGGDDVVCENRGSGIGAMTHAVRSAGLRDPEFEDRIGSFRVTLFNSATVAPQSRDRREEILALLSRHGELSTSELATQIGITPIAVRKWLMTMRQEGSIVPTAAPKSKNVRYRPTGKKQRS
jgi:ATP-dependent DNA helicase RecG